MCNETGISRSPKSKVTEVRSCLMNATPICLVKWVWNSSLTVVAKPLPGPVIIAKWTIRNKILLFSGNSFDISMPLPHDTLNESNDYDIRCFLGFLLWQKWDDLINETINCDEMGSLSNGSQPIERCVGWLSDQTAISCSLRWCGGKHIRKRPVMA